MPDFDLGQVLLQYACLLFSLCFHEAAHAFVADRCGDPSARLMGRISMNPLVHIDPVGTVVMPLLMLTTHIPLLGWAKPVPFNPRNLRDIRLDPVYIAIAGPLSNLLLAFVAAIILRGVVIISGPEVILSPIIGQMALTFIIINIFLFVFNFIPVPPLDGHHVLYYFLPAAGQQMLRQIGPFGIIIVLLITLKSGVIETPVEFLLSTVIRFVTWT